MRDRYDSGTKKDFGWCDEMLEMKEKMNEIALENPIFDFSKGSSFDISELVDEGLRQSAYGTP